MINNALDQVKTFKIGDLDLEKGALQNTQLFAWDAIQDCQGTDCPVYDRCNYFKEKRCGVQYKYLEGLYMAIFGTYGYNLDNVMLFKIGTQIIPLYAQLARMQLVELSLRNIMTIGPKGNEIVHPVFKEIRETMKTIEGMWKGLDLTFSFNQKINMGSKKPENGETPPAGNGNYYDTMIAGSKSESRKGVI